MARDPRTHTFARLADLHRKSGRLERALEVVEEGLAHHPHYLNARLVRARVLRELGRTDEAAAAFRLVLEIDEDNLVALEALESLGQAERLHIALPSEGVETVSTAGRWLARLEADWRSRPGPAPALGAAPDPGTEEPGATGEETVLVGASPNAPPEEAPASDVGSREAGATDDQDTPHAGSNNSGSGDAGSGDAGSGDAGPGDAAPGDPAASDSPGNEPARESAPSEAEEPPAAEVPTATLASLYLSQGLYDEAIGVFEKLLARDPYNAHLAQGLEEARRRHRSGSRPAARAPEAVTDGEKARTSPDRPESRSPAAEAGRATGRAGAPTIREFLGALLEGGAEVPDETSEGWRLRLERWLGGEGDDSPGA